MKTAAVLFLTSVGLGLTSVAHAQAPEVSAYCVSGGESADMAALQSDIKKGIEKTLADIRQKCRRGDTIVIPASSVAIIVKVCDFSRAVVSNGRNVLCVVVGVRPDR